MATLQLPAKAWLLKGYHEWADRNDNIAFEWIEFVDVCFDDGQYWGCKHKSLLVNGDITIINLAVPKRFIEFVPQYMMETYINKGKT